uniref:Uncharacterized protein n=1 Tax=Rhizophagus irregularis (strain DAOM 181602 / DAOM 197198 / MUCL 43194) TaxID=747089 RepID=U9TKG4_RHIID
MDDDSIEVPNCVGRFHNKKEKFSKQMRSQHRQFLEKVRINSYQKIIRKNIYDLIEDLNNSTNPSSLKILKCMIEDPSIRLSENEIYDLLEELTYIQEPYEQDNLVEFETRIIVISSVLEYVIFNIEIFHLGAGFYEVISNQLEDYVLSYRNYSSNVSWATSLNYYIPKEETIHKYNLEFLLEYIFNILKILRDNELQFRKVNLHVDHFLKVLVKSFEYSGKKGPSSFPSLKQSWETLHNTCDFGDLVSPFFTDYYLLKKIKSIIQNWSYEGDKRMISKYGKWLLMEFMWMHADNIWIEEIKCDRKKSCNDEILTQYQLKSIIFLFGILDMIENYIIESEHLPTLALSYYFAKEFLQKTKSAPIQIKSTVILLKLYLKNDFDRYFQDLNKDDIEAVSHFKSFLSDIKPKLYQESLSNYDNTIFDNFRGTILLPHIFGSLTASTCLDPYNIQSESLPHQRLNIQNDLSKIRWPLKVSKRLHPAHNEAIKSLNNKKYEETVLWLTCLLQQYPNSFSTRCDRAFINSFLLHKPYLALEDLNIALSLKTKSPHALNLRAETFRRIGYYDDALLDLKKALQLTPNNAISYGIRGALFYKMKRFNESLDDLNYSLQQLPNNGFCLGFLGATLVKLGFNDDALSKFNKALEINPDDIFILNKRAKLYHSLCLDNSGLIDINKALSINPFNHKALSIRGEIQAVFLDSDSESLSDINKSLEMVPNNVNALKIRARFYHEMDRNEEALNDLGKALNLAPNDISIFELRGEIYRSMCCFEEAIDDFNQMLQRDPCNIFALSYRGATKYDQELYEEALIDLNKALELRQENNLFLLKIRAKICIALKRYHEALMDQNKILDNEPNNNTVLLERRGVYQKLGLYDKSHSNSTHHFI